MSRVSFFRAMALSCALAAGSSWIATSQASVRNDGGGITALFPGVGMVGHDDAGSDDFDCTGAVVGDGKYILTAKHCVTDDGTITGTLLAGGDMRFKLGATTYFGDTITAIAGTDIAIIKLTNTTGVAGYDLYDTGVSGTEVAKALVSAGFGKSSSGNPAIGDVGSIWDLAYGTKREWTNTVDSIVVGGIAGQGMVLRMDFDAAGLTEGLGGPGDSGAPVFIGGTIAGVFSSSTEPEHAGTGSAAQINAAGTRALIVAAIPEPASLSLVVIPLVMLGRKR